MLSRMSLRYYLQPIIRTLLTKDAVSLRRSSESYAPALPLPPSPSTTTFHTLAPSRLISVLVYRDGPVSNKPVSVAPGLHLFPRIGAAGYGYGQFLAIGSVYQGSSDEEKTYGRGMQTVIQSGPRNMQESDGIRLTFETQSGVSAADSRES